MLELCKCDFSTYSFSKVKVFSSTCLFVCLFLLLVFVFPEFESGLQERDKGNSVDHRKDGYSSRIISGNKMEKVFTLH